MNELKPIPDNCYLTEIDDFVKGVRSTVFTDWDGHGYYANEKQMSDIRVDLTKMRQGKIDYNWTHVAWFNK